MAFPEGSIPVTGALGLYGETDDYATHFSQFGNGGLMSFPTRADMYAIPVKRRRFGMECNVTNEVGFIGKYVLSNLSMGGKDNSLTNDLNWLPDVVKSTGDYYVHYSTGKNIVGAGAQNNPFKTIQYAIANVPVGANIKVIKDDTKDENDRYVYQFIGVEKLNYNGTITFEDCKLTAILNEFDSYLVDNSNLKIQGTCTIDLVVGRFLKNTNTITNYIQNITGVTLIGNGNPVVTLGDITVTGASNSTISSVVFDSCKFQQRTNNTFSEFFTEENLNGSYFTFTNCSFSGYTLNWKNDAWNGFSTIKKSGFYGTSQFGFMATYIKVGRCNPGNNNQYDRILLIEDVYFDMASLGQLVGEPGFNEFGSPVTNYVDQSKAIVITDDNTELTLRNTSFTRYSEETRKSIYTDKNNVKIYAFNCVTYTPVQDTTNTLQITPAGEFKYYDILPNYVR